MLEYDKLYTVEDVAQKTGLTDRTIRNYLKDGRLKGKKIGGQWRFTADDIEALFRTPGEEDDREKKTDAAFDDPCSRVNPDVYAVVEYECDRVTANELSERIRAEKDNAANNYIGGKFEYIYNEKERRARFVLRGGADFVSAMLKMVKKQAKKG